MSSRPLVSVIIIFRNAEEFLEEAIESVLAQTYDRWELLLVDDGSTDRSIAAAKSYAERHHDKVRYLDHAGHQNRGMSSSRNLGIRNARGEYLFFLDADDVIVSATLAEQVAILETHPEAALVFGPLQYWFGWTGRAADAGRDYVENLGVPAGTLIQPPTMLALFLRDKATVPSGFLVRRKAVERVNGFEDAFRGEYEDQAFCAKLCLKESVFAAGRCWYRYRQHPQSCVAVGQRSGDTRSARLRFLSWLEGYLSSQGIKDAEVWHALRLELWPHRHPTLFSLTQRARYRLAETTRLTMRVAQRMSGAASRRARSL